MSAELTPSPSGDSSGKAWEKRFPFQVDVAGIIRLMGQSLYSRVDAAIRELIQNAHDGIMRRRATDLRYQGRIDILQRPDENVLEINDDGMGLTAEEVETYLGTVGASLSGILRREPDTATGPGMNLIGQFGIGLFSAFLLADKVQVITRSCQGGEGVFWEAGPNSDIYMCAADRNDFGTTVRLYLKADQAVYGQDAELLEKAIKEYAEFLPVPIYLNGGQQRVNVGTACWLAPTPDPAELELELESYFGETPLEVVVLRTERLAVIRGALYVTPQRTPGFTDRPTVTVTVQRMIISRRLDGLLPDWAPFIRGVLELPECSPTTSREDLVRNSTFLIVRDQLDSLLFQHFEELASKRPERWQSLIAWHRYLLAGAALEETRLRYLLRDTYRFITSHGEMTITEILTASRQLPYFSDDKGFVIWYNPNRHQESWINELFADAEVPCVHTLRSFEETLLTLMVADLVQEGVEIDLRAATPASEGFAETILEIRDLERPPADWQAFFADLHVLLQVGSYRENVPVLAFLSEQAELQRTFEALGKHGNIPAGFRRLMEAHFREDQPPPHEVILNRAHPLVRRALEQSTRVPLASVVRLLAIKALRIAGMPLTDEMRRLEQDDLLWIGEALWGRDA